MINIENTKLMTKLSEQYQEANESMRVRLPAWLYILDCWRGIFRDEDYYDTTHFPTSWDSIFGKVDRLKRNNQAFEIYFREIFKTTEAFLARLDRAYLTNQRPFQLNPPIVSRQMLDPQTVAQLKGQLEPVEKWLCYEYRRLAVADRQIRTLRDACLCDAGYAVVTTDFSRWYPVGNIKRFKPWEVWADPYNSTAADWEYAAYMETKPLREAKEIWMGLEKGQQKEDIEYELERYAVKESYRKYVKTLHFTGIYGSEAKDVGLDENKYHDIVVLADANGEPTPIVLDAYENLWQMIPIQNFGMLADPEEDSCYNVSLASTVEDEQEALNILGNRLIQQSEYATLQGGFYDSAYAGEFAGGLVTPKPGEWNPFPGSNKTMSEIFFPLKFPDNSGHFMNLMDRFRMEEGRKTGIQDYNFGISTPTQTNTLGETNMLKGESNEIFRAKAQRLDASFERLYRMFVLMSAYAIKRQKEADPEFELFVRDGDDVVPIQPEIFDEEYEVNLNGGAAAIDGPARAMKLTFYTEKAMQWGVRAVDPDKAYREILELDNIDAGKILKSEEQIAMEQQQQAAMAMVAMAAQAGQNTNGEGKAPKQAQGGATVPPVAGDMSGGGIAL